MPHSSADHMAMGAAAADEAKTAPAFAGLLVVGLLCLFPLVGALTPRFAAYFPGVIGVLGLAACVFMLRRAPTFSPGIFIWSLVIVGLMGLSVLWSVDPAFTAERAQKTALVFAGGILMIAALRSVPAVSLAAFYRLFPLGVLAGGLACLLDLYGAGWLYRQMNGLDVMPADMTYSQFNRGVMIFTFSLLGVWPCLLSPVWQGRSKILMIGALALAAGFVIAGTSSQSAQMALVLAVIMMALFPVSRPKACYALAGFVVLALAAAPVAAQILFDMLAPTIESAPWLKDGYAASRLEIWNFIAARALQSPWIGFGAEATRVITDFETQRLYHPDSFVLHPHNFALQVWIEFGALGALVCAGFLCDIIRRIWRLPGRLTRQVALGVFVAIISSAATSYGLWQGWWIGTFFMMIGIVTALDRLDQATKET